MIVAVIILGGISILSLAMAAMLLARLLKTGHSERDQQNLLGHQVTEVRDGLSKVENAVVELKTAGVGQSSEIKAQLTGVASQMASLNSTNTALREALANTRFRGQWGERMAEDVFRIAGLEENINYVKQAQIPNGQARPDFTIYMPGNKTLNMDAKFPLDNYLKCLEADTAEGEEQARIQFLKDVRDRLKEVVGRGYIDPPNGTLDHVLVFIPNEQMYHFVLQHGAGIFDEALGNNVVPCSPISLFAILGVIRHAQDNFDTMSASDKILSELGSFNNQWERFVGQMGKLGRSIESAQKDFEALTTTRKRALDRRLRNVEDMRQQRGLPVAGEDSLDGILEPDELELELAESEVNTSADTS